MKDNIFAKNKKIVILTYLIIGLLLFFYESKSAVMFFTVFTFHFYILYRAYKYKSIVFSSIYLLLFISQGINSVLFFINKNYYDVYSGFNSIGMYKYDLISYYKAYSYIFIYSVITYLMMELFYKYNKSEDYFVIFNKLRLKNTFNIDKYKNMFYVFLILSSILSIIMYKNQIGVKGLVQTSLPLHLTGIFYYTRLFIISLAIIVFYLFSNKKTNLIIIFMYLFIASICSVSKYMFIIVIVPLIIIDIFKRNYLLSVISLFYFFIMYFGIQAVSNEVYKYNYIYYSIKELIKIFFLSIKDCDVVDILSVLHKFSERIYGTQTIILTSQYNILNTNGFIRYIICGSEVQEMFPDIAAVLYKLYLDDQMAFGVSLGFPGTLIITSCGFYSITVIETLIDSVCFSIFEKQIISNYKKLNIFHFIFSTTILLFTLILYWTGNRKYLNLCTIILIIINIIKKKGNM